MKMNSRIASVLFGALVLAGGMLFAYGATLRTTVNHAVTASYAGSNDLGSPAFNLSANAQAAIVLATGTGSNQANAIFADQRTLSASATEDLDLFGSLTDPLGATLSFATVKVIKVCAAAANTNNVNIGGGTGNFNGPFIDQTDKLAVKPGGCFLWAAPGTGATVTNTSGDKLEFANSGASTAVTYDLIIVGTQ